MISDQHIICREIFTCHVLRKPDLLIGFVSGETRSLSVGFKIRKGIIILKKTLKPINRLP